MVRINLLPENKRPSLMPASENILLLIGIIAFFINAAFAAFNYCDIMSLKEQLAQVEQHISLLRPNSAKLAANREKQLQIDTKINLLLKLTDERMSLHALLAHLSDIMPQEVWLSETSVKKTDRRENNTAGVTLILKGQTTNYDGTASFMQKIEQDEYFANVILLKAEKDETLNYSRFEITANIKNF